MIGFESMLERLGPAAGLALVVKVTLILMAGTVFSWLLRRRTAAARHFTWFLTLVGVLGVTAFAAIPGGVNVTIPQWPRAESVGPTLRAAGGGMLAPQPQATIFEKDEAALLSDPGTPVSSPRATGLPTWTWPLLTRLWLWGACLVLAWFALGYAGLALISRRSEPVEDPEWRSLLDRMASQFGLPRGIPLRRSAAVSAPLVCGLFRPTILLPAEADSWSGERRRVVLLHELAHVLRHDPLAQGIAWVACSLYWFHPGVWIAARRLRRECEWACDDRVLSSGVEGPEYASHLLSLASRARSMRLAGSAAIAMARKSTLEGRLLSLLDAATQRGGLTSRVRVAGFAALALVLFGLGLMRPVSKAVAQSEDESYASEYEEESDDEDSDDEGYGEDAKHKDEHEHKDEHAEEDAEDVADTEDMVGMASFDRQAPAKPGETLVLKLDTGGTVTIRGWGEPRVEVRGALAGPDWNHQELSLEREGDQIVLSAMREKRKGTHSFSTSNRFTVHVPHRFDVQITSAGGNLAIRDVEGTFEGETGGGRLTLEHLKGRAELSTGGGDIQVNDCDLSGSVSTGGGLVRLSRVRGGLKGNSGSGPVIYSEASAEETGDLDDLEVDESRTKINYRKDSKPEVAGAPVPKNVAKRSFGPAGLLNIEKAGGAIFLDRAPNGVRATTGGGLIEIGRSGSLVDASTGGGDIQIGPAAGSVRAGTGAGDVHVILDRGMADRTVHITSGSGKVVLDVPAGMPITFDVETAYTRANKPSRIHSDFPLEYHATTDWDDSEGTPRRYVRARSSGGGPRVRIKTVNGDIEIRRTSRSL